MAERQPTPPRPARGGPFIMPDGRPLTTFLDSQQLRPPRGSGQKRRPGAVRDVKQGWTKPLPRGAAAAGSYGSSGQSEAEQAELAALRSVGQRKQRRWLNDKLLRDMAGQLTAHDMASLFKPVPFGEQRTSLWEVAAQPQHAVLWDLFRNLDMDKQGRVLEKWEAHVRELQAGPAAIANPAVDAIAAWAGVSAKARQAMKRSSPAHVAGIEAQILCFLEEDPAPGAELVVSGLEGGFHRLIAHGLAEFHGLVSHSRLLPDGSGDKEVVVRRRAAAAHPAPAAAPGAAAGADEEWEEQRQAAEAEAAAAEAAAAEEQAPRITCADILHVLLDDAQPLTPAALHNAYVHSMDSSSEAGDHPHRHHVQHSQQQHQQHEQQHQHQQHHHSHEHQQHPHSHQQQAAMALATL